MFLSSLSGSSKLSLNEFKLDGRMIRYSQFVPRLYNFCLSLGMEPGKIIPSRAFCSDESQGFPVILIAKQFGAFPFNHGQVGGVVSTERHGPHASHGEDLMIIQASHVGYEPEDKKFGVYRRIQTQNCELSSNCGKISGTLKWYLEEFEFAQANIMLEPVKDNQYQISINNLLLQKVREEGLMLKLEDMIAHDSNGKPALVRTLSTACQFVASEKLIESLSARWPKVQREAIGKRLGAELFYYKRKFKEETEEGSEHLEKNLLASMPWIVTHPEPTLAAAQFTTQREFDRAYRSIINEPTYKNRNLVFISGLNIDISPNSEKQIFPLTKFVPWAAYIQKKDGSHLVMEQKELFETLMSFGTENSKQIDLEKEINVMDKTEEVKISYDFLDQE